MGITSKHNRYCGKGRFWQLLAVAFVCALIATACGNDSETGGTTDTTPDTTSTSSAEPDPTPALSGTIGFIKGPHSAMEAEFQEQIIADFKAQVAPDVNVNFSTYDWPVHVAELTTLFASGS
ncbi:MAG: hypothetical protein OXB90_04625, partial [Acidimicrobiaceae bacterium]|nr:hypothetical protein [Acidimicrobiaceae bacterium]